MSQASKVARWSRAVAAAGLVTGGILFATSSPASANSNFNGSCESAEACFWNGSIYEGTPWDYEGTDTNFTNNYYPKSGPKLDNSAAGINNNGTSCTAAVGQNVGGASAQGWIIRLGRGGTADLYYSTKNNQASSLWWEC